MTEVLFPMMSSDPEDEGVVGTWFVLDGESVTAGQLVAEVQVDKVSADVEAPAAGTLHHVKAEGDVLAQGEVIARIEP